MKRQQNLSPESSVADMISDIKKLGVLYITRARIKGAEKITMLVSSVVFAAVLVVIGFFFLIFGSVGAKRLLEMLINPAYAYLAIAGFFFILFILLVLLRKPLFINPVARFVSKMMLEDPTEVDEAVSEAYTTETTHSDTENTATHSNVKVEIDYDLLAKRVVLMLEKDKTESAENDEND